jgi:hypothetical protein
LTMSDPIARTMLVCMESMEAAPQWRAPVGSERRSCESMGSRLIIWTCFYLGAGRAESRAKPVVREEPRGRGPRDPWDSEDTIVSTTKYVHFFINLIIINKNHTSSSWTINWLERKPKQDGNKTLNRFIFFPNLGVEPPFPQPHDGTPGMSQPRWSTAWYIECGNCAYTFAGPWHPLPQPYLQANDTFLYDVSSCTHHILMLYVAVRLRGIGMYLLH